MSTQNTADKDLARLVKLCLSEKRNEFRKLSVWADNGVVRLSGEIGSYHVRQLAISIARQVAGVLHVTDDMHVSLPMGLPTSACAVIIIEPHCLSFEPVHSSRRKLSE
jgi:hypothetical protein